MRTSAIAALILVCTASFAPAQPHSPEGRAELFAICLGTYVAEAEAFGGAAKARRDLLADLYDAVLPDALQAGLTERRLIGLRADARLRQRALLDTGRFDPRPERRAPARATAAQRLTQCDALLLGT